MNWIELKAAFLRTNWLTNQLTNIQFKTSLRLKLSQNKPRLIHTVACKGHPNRDIFFCSQNITVNLVWRDLDLQHEIST